MLYVIKSAITLALLYSCFFVFLSKETFHRFNRFMLVGIMLVSLVMPLFHFTTSHPTALNEEVHLMQTYIEQDTTPIIVTAQHTQSITWMQALTWLYLAGVATLIIITLVQAVSLIRFMRNGIRHTDSRGNTIILHSCDVPPFSIFRFIVMSVKDYETSRPYILTHEQEHIRLGHTYDLLLLQCVKTLQWFNPFIWFLSRDLKAVHEYEADQAVINQGIDAKTYQQLLVIKVVGDRLQPFTNNLNHGSLKKRILMMYQKPKTKWGMLKALCAIPVVALTINAFATPTETDPIEDMVTTLEKKEVPTFNEVKEKVLTTTAETVEAMSTDDKTPFTIHPVRDQYGRIVGFDHKGEPADCDKDFNCTYEYIFIDDRPATEEEVRNYNSFESFSLLKTPNGTARYNYKDKKGIICFTTYKVSINKDGKEPLFIVDGKIVEVDVSKLGKEVNVFEDDDMLKLLNIKSKEDIAAVYVYQPNSAAAIERWGDKAKNGVICIEIKKFAALPKDTVLAKLPGVEQHEDGTVTINGKTVKKVVVEGKTVYEDEDPLFDVCEDPAKYPGGQGAMMEFLSRNLRYPKEAVENGIQSRIILQFIVEKDGSLSSFKVLENKATNTNGITLSDMITVTAAKIREGIEVTATPEELQTCTKLLEDEAIRVVKLMPKWEPAKQRGKQVRMKYVIPVTFRLQ